MQDGQTETLATEPANQDDSGNDDQPDDNGNDDQDDDNEDADQAFQIIFVQHIWKINHLLW